VTNAYVCRLLHSLAAPEIVEAILDGRQPKGPTLAEMRWNRPVVCEEQRKVWLCFWSVGGLKLEHHHPSWVIHSHRLVLEALAARSPRKRPHLQLRRFHVRL
jgi:hypothetical protein